MPIDLNVSRVAASMMAKKYSAGKLLNMSLYRLARWSVMSNSTYQAFSLNSVQYHTILESEARNLGQELRRKSDNILCQNEQSNLDGPTRLYSSASAVMESAMQQNLAPSRAPRRIVGNAVKTIHPSFIFSEIHICTWNRGDGSNLVPVGLKGLFPVRTGNRTGGASPDYRRVLSNENKTGSVLS
eukprot:gb/GECG01011557.1/.p1 GENE.gb/GECG01011557.1/~~gb/GECG01011557.1/.p1  ORF type:complete len:185 (+),score=6.40 gb/GECG01011557.1/:1-555(+)